MCFDRASGKLLWQSGVTYAEREQTQRDNPYCAATPVTDGERVIASFGSAGVYCYDFSGKELWHRDLGKMNHMFGNASSPMLAGDLCILNFGPDQRARLIAMNKKSGETVWEAEPPKVDPSEQPQMRGGFAGGGGGRGFGLGSGIAPQMFAQGDKDNDKKLTKEEFTAVADLWFDKVDPQKTGKLTREQFAERFYDAVPRREEPGDAAASGVRRVSRTTAPAFFGAADADKDEALTRAELRSTFAKWFAEWDSEKKNALEAEKFESGLNAALPRGNFAGSGFGNGGRGGGTNNSSGRAGGSGGGATWSTPILIKANRREELIVSFPNRLAAYDSKTGKQLWISKGVGGTIYTTPVWGENTLYAMSSGPGGGGAIAVRPGGNGDVTESERLWRLERAKSAIGSGVIYEGHLYTISQDGIAACLDLKTGNTMWEERLRGSGSRNSSWSSMLLADGRIFVPNQSGDVFILRASPKYELLATNSVGEPTNASLAAADGELFLRTDKSLWCFAGAK
jgi:outer membrane protein assembly factor BamB